MSAAGVHIGPDHSVTGAVHRLLCFGQPVEHFFAEAAPKYGLNIHAPAKSNRRVMIQDACWETRKFVRPAKYAPEIMCVGAAHSRHW